MLWRYADDPEGGQGHLAESSVGLNVEHPALGPDTTNVVRFDFEGWGHRKAHLHVLQLRPLGTSVHWLLPDRNTEEWEAATVLDFLLSQELADDLNEAGWDRLGAPG